MKKLLIMIVTVIFISSTCGSAWANNIVIPSVKVDKSCLEDQEQAIQGNSPVQENYQVALSKIRSDLKLQMQSSSSSDTIQVEIYLSNDPPITVDDLLKQEKDFQSVIIEKLNDFTFSTKATPIQIEKWAQLSQVKRITLPSTRLSLPEKNLIELETNGVPLSLNENKKIHQIEDCRVVNLSVGNNRYVSAPTPIAKIRSDLKERMQSCSSTDTIKVEIYLSNDPPVTVSEFLQQEKDLENVNIEKLTDFSLSVNATSKQIEKWAQLSQVKRITLPSTRIKLPLQQNMQETISQLNATLTQEAEMTGALKARQDFGVTGDRDGNENSYSSQDIVIAILDTGIYTNHATLDGGKVIGWVDLVDSRNLTPVDPNGHGTAVASIAAGASKGNSTVQDGFAPGAALVGIRIGDTNGEATIDTIIDGIDWAVDHRNQFNIDIFNLSFGTSGLTPAEFNDLNTVVTNARNAGILPIIAAGNSGPAYNTLAQTATCTSALSVGAAVDPTEGGWSAAEFSSRGSGSTGPFIMGPGYKIKAAENNTTNGYKELSGTSYASPAIAGISALMMDAAGSGGSLSYYTYDYGKSGFDPIWGNGLIAAYDSIKSAGGYSTGSFSQYIDHYAASNTIPANSWHVYTIEVDEVSPDLYFTTQLTMIDEDTDNFNLYIWNPGRDPYVNPSDYSCATTEPQETIRFKPSTTGVYTVAVNSISGSGNYTIDFCGRFR